MYSLDLSRNLLGRQAGNVIDVEAPLGPWDDRPPMKSPWAVSGLHLVQQHRVVADSG